MKQHRRLISHTNLLMFSLALFVVSSTFVDGGKWGHHWVFVSAYVFTLLWCLWRRYWMAALTTASLIWLRVDLATNAAGFELRLSSSLFAVLYFALCGVPQFRSKAYAKDIK